MHNIAIYYPKGHAAHYEPGHPERPERIEVIRKALQKEDWWVDALQINPVVLTQEVMQAIHDPAYLTYLQTACDRGQHLDMDTYTTPASWELALNTAGGAAAVAGAVWRREARRGFAITRPPGHHATHNRGMGFCLLNNIALAAEYLFQQESAQRLAIVDLDLHHGNGTQEIFWRRVELLYISTHQYPHYPGTGALEETGAGIGNMTVANIPLPPYSGDRAFRSAMEEVILPVLSLYQPEMVLVSYGFDTHWRDPLGQLLLSAQVYGEIISRLSEWGDQNCSGRIALFLEGGYDLEAGVACTSAVINALIGSTWADKLGPSPTTEIDDWKPIIENIRRIWSL
jgi:acetoin utilization deacetylase AcuC-like enzyme